MATVNKDFRVKNGLVVEGTTATVNGSNVLTENSTEFLQDTTADMLVNGTSSGITFTYNDTTGVIDAAVSSTPTFTTEITFEGATADSYETVLQVQDPTADRTITLPDASGTVALTSDIPTSTTDISEGTNLYYTSQRVRDVLTGSTQTNIVIEEVMGELIITAENGVADATTDDLDEGTTNKYYTDARARDAISGTSGVSYDNLTGVISADTASIATSLNTTFDAYGAASTAESNANGYTDTAISGLSTVYDAYGAASTAESNANGYTDTAISGLSTVYDPYGAASTVAGDLTSHISDTSTHGVTGDIVGTTDTQNLSNKTITDSLHFKDGSNDYSAIHANAASLNIDGNTGITLFTVTGDILLNPDNNVYVGSPVAGNRVAVQDDLLALSSGLNWKKAVNVLANGNIALSGSTPLAIDSHTLSDGYRVLLTAQSTASQNGIYDLSITGGSYTLTRSADADTNDELIAAAVFVMEGDVYASTSWVQANHYISSFANQDWTQFSGQGTYTAGTGILIDGTEISNTGVISLTGTTDQVSVSGSTGDITLSLPQDIASTSSPTFVTANLGSVTLANALIGSATQSLTNTSATVVDSFDASLYSGAKYLVQMKNGDDIEILEVLVAVDGNHNVYLTEYADVISNLQIGTTDADYSGGNVRLLVSATNGTTVKVHKTLIEA